MNLRDITSVGRSVDLRLPSNRAAVAATIAVTAAGALWQLLSGEPWFASAAWGAQAGIAVFLAWALCRELDPDHPLAAFAAIEFGALGLFLWGLPRLDVALWLVVLMRVVNRTTGLSAGVLDSLGLLGLGGWLTMKGNFGTGVITALAFVLDSLLPDPARRRLAFAALALIVTVVVGILGDIAPGQIGLSPSGALIGLALSLAFMPVILASGSLESVGDQTGRRLIPIRVQAAQVLGLLAGTETAFLRGPAAITALSPLWAATVGAAVIWLVAVLMP